MEELLKKIQENIGAILGRNKDLADRLGAIESKVKEDGDSIIKRVEEEAEKREEFTAESEKWFKDLERQLNKKRFGTGASTEETDALLAALPEHLKQQLPMLQAVKGGERLFLRNSEDGTLLMRRNGEPQTRSHTQANWAQRDPVGYLAVGGWFQAKARQCLAGIKGDIEAANKAKEEADKLSDAMGGVSSYSKAALQEDTAAEGGDLVPTMVEEVIGRIIKDFSVVRSAGPTIIPMTTKIHQLPTLANDFTITLESEEATIADSAPATPFSQSTLTAKKFAGLVTVSEELIEDNVVALMDFVMTHLLELIAITEDTQALEGDGAGNNFTGLFSVSGTNSVAGGSNALTIDELIGLIYGSDVWGSIINGVIWCHPRIIRDALQMTVSNHPLFIGGIINSATPMTLFGTRLFPTGQILRNRGGGTDETTAYHGNPRGIVIGDRTGSTFKVDPFTKMDTAQIRLRVMKRTGIVVWTPGRFTKLTAVTV